MAACPSCGVAVVPGYVKCPKCGGPLPVLARTKSSTFGSGGGTVVPDGPSGSRTPLFVALGAGLVIAIVLVVALGGGGGGSKTASTTATTSTPEGEDDEPTTQPTQPAQQVDEPDFTPTQPADTSSAAQTAAVELERELKRQRLWGTTTVVEQRIDIRSGSCDAKDMGTMVDAASARLQGAGLTKLRCLAQSGAVVFERDL